MRTWSDEQGVGVAGRVADPNVSATDGLDAADVSVHSVLLSVHAGGSAEVRFAEGVVDGVAADSAMPPVPTWRARPGAMMKDVIDE